ncbi:hypothetical protein ACWNT8_06600 [Pigmentibacter ruber]
MSFASIWTQFKERLGLWQKGALPYQFYKMKIKMTLLFVSLFLVNQSTAFAYSFSSPKEYPIKWNNLIAENPSPLAKEFVRSAEIINKRLMHGNIPYPSKKISLNWEKGYNHAEDKFVFMRKYGVDCTRLLRYLYINMLHLPYNSKFSTAPIISKTFTHNNPESMSQLKNFDQVPKTKQGFKPQTGDILAFPGHTIAVLDPENCIAIQSSIWLCKKSEKGFCVDYDYGESAGVSIYHLASERFCKNGIWKGMDNNKLKFTIGWRHKAFNTWILTLPKEAKPGETILISGKNLANKYIYFTGSKTPVKARQIKRSSIYLKDHQIQTVKITVPNNATTGKLKVFWGTGKPSPEKTVESQAALNILNCDNHLVSIHSETFVD